MPTIRRTQTVIVITILCLAVFAALYASRVSIQKKSVPAEPPQQVVPEKAPLPKGWLTDFTTMAAGRGALPPNWLLQTKPGTKAAVFSLMTDRADNVSSLHMEADSASGSLITRPDGVDIRKTPILQWRWRVLALPEGADGRARSKDDQAIGVYVGSGSTLSNKSISYRWDTDTPKGTEGDSTYGFGVIKVKWITLRNKEDAAGEWFVEERNVAEDFRQAWGYYPDDVYICVSSNSQYTGTRAEAELGWIGFDTAGSGQ